MPPGRYQVFAWHERFTLEPSVPMPRDVVVTASPPALSPLRFIDAGQPDPTGKTLSSITFGNANNGPHAALAIYAVTVRDAGGGTPVCRADFNGDNFLDFFDYIDYVTCFEDGTCPPGKTADFNGDDFADFFDYDDFVAAFEAGC